MLTAAHQDFDPRTLSDPRRCTNCGHHHPTPDLGHRCEVVEGENQCRCTGAVYARRKAA